MSTISKFIVKLELISTKTFEMPNTTSLEISNIVGNVSNCSQTLLNIQIFFILSAENQNPSF